MENLGKTLRYQTPLLMRAADGSRTHVPGLEGEYNSRYTTAANLFINIYSLMNNGRVALYILPTQDPRFYQNRT